jgi:alpha-L-rhamnosidase
MTVIASALPVQAQWAANWIWQSADGPADTWMCFRKTFSLTAAPTSAIACISADSKYWLYVNDSLVVREGNLKRGPDSTGGYYDSLDLAPYLTSGSNTVAALVAYWGVQGFSHRSSGRGGFVFQMNAGGTNVVSDATWKARVHPAFSACGTQPNYRISERSVRFSAAADIPAWYTKSFSDASWSSAVAKGLPPATPWRALTKRPIPLWKDYGVANYVNNAALGLPRTGAVTLKAALPYNMQVNARFTVSSTTAGLVVSVNSSTNAEQSLIAQYLTAGTGADETFEVPIWLNGDTIRYTIPANVTVRAVSYRRTGYNSAVIGTFLCNDAYYNTLWRKCVNTLEVCMRDNYFDCPDRERALWWGDVVLEIGQTFYVLDRNADLLSAKSIRELMNWQRADKTIFAPVPAGNWANELPVQMLASVGSEGFWNYFRYSADTALMREVYPRVRDYLSVWSLGGNGLVVHRAGGWDWTDWGTNIDINILDNCWYYLALKAAIPMAAMSGYAGDTAGYRTRMNSITSNFVTSYWNTGGQYFMSSSVTIPDDRANAMAVIAGLAQPQHYAGISTVLTQRTFASPWMEKWVEEAFILMKNETASLARMRTRYQTMVNSWSSTLWENFPASGTPNHSWAGGPLTLLSQYVAGVAPESPGFSTYHVLPMLGSLTAVSATVPSVKGLISVSDSLTASQFVMNLTSPSGTRALVGIPKKRAWLSVTGNGQTIWNQGTFTTNVPGITGAGEDSLYIKFNVNPGTWRFVALLTATGIQGVVKSAVYNETLVQFRRMVSFLNVSITTEEKFNVSVFDLSGKIVCRYVGRGGANVPVPNSILDRGIRLICIEVGGKSFVKKIVTSNK